jgi:hypothetical protein
VSEHTLPNTCPSANPSKSFTLNRLNGISAVIVTANRDRSGHAGCSSIRNIQGFGSVSAGTESEDSFPAAFTGNSVSVIALSNTSLVPSHLTVQLLPLNEKIGEIYLSYFQVGVVLGQSIL